MRAKVQTSGPPKHMGPPESLTSTNTERLTGNVTAGGLRDTEKAGMTSREVRGGREEAGGSEKIDTGENGEAGEWWRTTRLTSGTD